MTDNFKMVVDTREQTPLNFKAETVRGTLHSGDYSIEGFENQFCVERKSIADLVGTILETMKGERNAAGGSMRFHRELERMSFYESAYVAVTSPIIEIKKHNYRSMISPASVIAKIHSLEAQHGVRFCFFANSRECAEWIEGEALHFVRNRSRASNSALGDLADNRATHLPHN